MHRLPWSLRETYLKALMPFGAVALVAVACHRGECSEPGQPEPQEATCKSSMTLCEREAAGECEYQGYTVLGSYVESSTFHVPEYHLKYVCGRQPGSPNASAMAAKAPAAPPTASAAGTAESAPDSASDDQIDPSWM